MLRLLLWLVLAIGATGCAADNRRLYKEGATQADYDRDAFECEKATRQSAQSFGTGVLAQTYAKNFAIRCMTATKGYRFE